MEGLGDCAQREGCYWWSILKGDASMERLDYLRSLFSKDGIGLEIGPQGQGIAPRRDGYNVRIIDYIGEEELRCLHAATPEVRKELIEHVDYVSSGRPIGEVITDRNCFDYIVASHVIEHMPDFLGFLIDCQSLLKPDGKLILAVPDKRLTFDAFRPLTTLGPVLDAHARRAASHPAERILEQYAYATNRGNEWIVWNHGSTDELNLIHPIAEARRQYETAQLAVSYIDVHAWIFTPSSFRLLMRDLHEMGSTSLREEAFGVPQHPTWGMEFYVSLSASGAGCDLSRSELMRRTIEECAEIKTGSSKG
jgi:predicted SAM-dependent methyltransferase